MGLFLKCDICGAQKKIRERDLGDVPGWHRVRIQGSGEYEMTNHDNDDSEHYVCSNCRPKVTDLFQGKKRKKKATKKPAIKKEESSK